MTAAPKKHKASAEPVAWENPLIPNKMLRALYGSMVELRLLEEHLSTLPRQKRSSAVVDADLGNEGCRVSTTFDLKPGDLTSEGKAGIATRFLRGTKLNTLLQQAQITGPEEDAAQHLPAISDAVGRLHVAMGAASVLKTSKKGLLVVAYARAGEMTAAAWKPVLRFAAESVLPILFVVLPGASIKKPGQLSLSSSKFGVPGIPVDAADPVALFRVAQESMLRVRAGGGPVLMECIPFQLAGKKALPPDPIETMREFLLHRRIVDEAWLAAVVTRFHARLRTVR